MVLRCEACGRSRTLRTVLRSANGSTVRANPLKTKGETTADDADANCPLVPRSKTEACRLEDAAVRAAEALKLARAAGIRLGIDGDALTLEAATEPSSALLDLLSRHKAAVVALLRTDGDGWSGRTGSPSSTSEPG